MIWKGIRKNSADGTGRYKIVESRPIHAGGSADAWVRETSLHSERWYYYGRNCVILSLVEPFSHPLGAGEWRGYHNVFYSLKVTRRGRIKKH